LTSDILQRTINTKKKEITFLLHKGSIFFFQNINFLLTAVQHNRRDKTQHASYTEEKGFPPFPFFLYAYFIFPLLASPLPFIKEDKS